MKTNYGFKKSIYSFFWIGYIALVICMMLNNITVVQPYLEKINIVGTLIITIFMLYINISRIPIRKNPKHYILMAVLFALSLVGRNYTGNYTFFKLLLVCYSLYNMPLKDFVKMDLFIKLALFAVVLVCLPLGLCETTSFIRYDTVRYTLGFIHPNTAGFFLMMLPIEYIYVYNKHKTIRHVLAVAIAMAIAYFATGSRAAVVCLLIFLLLYFFSYKSRKDKKVLLRYFLYMMPFILTAVSFGIVYMYSQDINGMNELNNILSDRPHYALAAIEQYPLSLFGSSLPQGIVVDNAYVFYSISLGVPVYICCMILLSLEMGIGVKKKDKLMIISLLTILLYSLVERTTLMIAFNPFLAGISPVLFYSNSRGREIGMDKNG